MKLTKSFIDALPLPEKDRRNYFDSEIKGFGVTVFSSGTKSFFVVYGNRLSRKKMIIGKYGTITLEQARVKARELLSDVILNEANPLEEKKAEAKAETLGEWINKYIEIAGKRKKSIRDDMRYLSWENTENKKANKRGVNKKKSDEFIPSDWKKKKLKDISVNDLNRRFDYLTKNISPLTANHWLASIRACLQEAWRRELIEVNPAMRIRINSISNERDRVLSDTEFIRLKEAIDQLEDIHAKAAFFLLTETGARLSEVLNAKWKDIKFELSVWNLPKTKAGKKQTIPLQQHVIEMLQKLPKDSLYIVAGTNPKEPRKDLKRPWKKILEISELEDLHIHDLRRTFCVQIVKIAGVNIASKLLRHSDIRITTKHYSPEDSESLLAALQKRADILEFKKTGSENK